jgi:hypothetical protein
MGHKAEKASDSSEADAVSGFRARLVRKQGDEWVRCCPNCFSTNIVPSRPIAGIVEQGTWECRSCGYHGATIEANRGDLADLLSHRRVPLSPEEKNASYLDNKKPSRRDTGL